MIRVTLMLMLLLACTRRVETPNVQTTTTPPAKITVSPPPAPAAPIRTDRSSYVFTNGPRGPEATIVATLRAPADQTLYILNCNGASGSTLQRKNGDQWEYAWIVTMAACASPPIVVPPGGEHTAQIFLHDYPGTMKRIETGLHRVVWTGVLTSVDPKTGRGPDLPEEQRVSAPFMIEAPPRSELTLSEAERLVTMLADAINEPARDTTRLVPYVLHGPEALRAALVQYRTFLGKVATVRRVKEFIFRLEGTKGTSSVVEAQREDRIRIHGALLDYAFRAEGFMKAYLGAIANGDAERLARVLNPDDIDFPVPRAREMIDGYRKRYRDVRAIRAEFIGVDERTNILRWRLRGPGPQGEEVTEPIDLGFGDGLIGIRGL